MARSLNQAFIKAYKKGAGSRAEVASNEETYIVRVDTASVSIPAPHMLAPRSAAASATTAGGPTPHSASAVGRDGSEAVATASGREGVDSELRESIANQMLQSGYWLDNHIDTFIGGFPQVTRVAAERPVETPPAQDALPGGSTVASGASSPAAAVVSVARAEVQATAADESSRGGETVSSVKPSESVASESVAGESVAGESVTGERTAESQAGLAEASGVNSPSDEFWGGRGEPKEAHALPPPAAPALSPTAFEEALEELASERREKGEIFRLDRPSYAYLVGDQEDALSDESFESLSNFESSSNSTLDFDPARLSGQLSSAEPEAASADSLGGARQTAQPMKAADQAKTEAVKAVEEGLRRAKLRVFNPVWEVDRLQWPEVCLELMQRQDPSLQRVARNLIEACHEGLQVLAVTSTQGGEGRTTVACCLAMLAGSHGLNTVVVDGDIENPTLMYQTNLDVEQDWKSAILNQCSLEEVAVHSIDDQITLLPLLNPINHSELSSDDNRVAFMLQELAESFDLVIVDMGPMDSSRTMVTTLGEQGIINAVVAVVDQRSSSPVQLESCLSRIRRTGVASIGLVENFTHG